MQIKTLSGHLTATEKRHIRAMIEQGLTEGRVGKKSYWLKEESGVFTVLVGQNERSVFNRIEFKKYKHTFLIKG